MKFLIDRCAGRRLAQWLQTQGHDVVHAADLGPDPGDHALIRHAAQEQRVTVTLDTDFGTLIHSRDVAHAGLVRLPDVRVAERIRLMEVILARHAGDLNSGAIVTVKANRIRVSRTWALSQKSRDRQGAVRRVCESGGKRIPHGRGSSQEPIFRTEPSAAAVSDFGVFLA